MLRTPKLPEFTAQTPEEDIAAFVDTVGQFKKPSHILRLLVIESHPLYQERGTNEVIRIQGYILAAFEKHGLPLQTLPVALEALESSMSAYLVAAAAKAIRGLKRKNAQLIKYLLAGIDNIYAHDDTVTFSTYKPLWPLTNPTTAIQEILVTFQWLGNAAKDAIPDLQRWATYSELNATNRQRIVETMDIITKEESTSKSCCDMPITTQIPVSIVRHTEVLQIPLEDQDGAHLTYGSFFKDKPTVLVFFYTRCDNHNKCSLTINKLGKVQKLLQQHGLEGQVKTAAVSYDPVFDTPERLKTYAVKRHVAFGTDYKAFRVVDKTKMDTLLTYFNSAVNYVGNLINKHQIELYILDEHGKPITSLIRMQWEPEEVVHTLAQYLADPSVVKEDTRSTFQKVIHLSKNSILPICIVFFPKCPFCWAAYMSVFSVAGISSIPYSPWLLPVLCVLLLINLWFIGRRAQRKGSWLGFGMAVLGTLLLVVFGALFSNESLMVIGLVILMLSALVNSLSIPLLSMVQSWRVLKR